MPRVRDLPNKPLVEAIFELRWRVSPEQGDPHYPVLIGKLYERLESKYPFHEPLPTAIFPQPMLEGIVQHRFRSGKERWPLIQIGPGIVTLNDTHGYTWQDFGQRAKDLVQATFQAYPKPDELQVTSLLLRYIDAVEFDFARDDVLRFLRQKLKTRIVFPATLSANMR